LLDSVALNLHGFYSGIEKLLERIAKGLDNHLPGGNSWHQALLKQMVAEVAGIRPKVISESMFVRLDEYRRFRHVVSSLLIFSPDDIDTLEQYKELTKLLTDTEA